VHFGLFPKREFSSKPRKFAPYIEEAFSSDRQAQVILKIKMQSAKRQRKMQKGLCRSAGESAIRIVSAFLLFYI